jgi:hypothetical protein
MSAPRGSWLCNAALPERVWRLKWVGLADGVRLSVFDVYGALVEQRDFVQPFLDSGKRVEIMPALEGGSLRLTVWGGDGCDAFDASEFE